MGQESWKTGWAPRGKREREASRRYHCPPKPPELTKKQVQLSA